LQTGRSYKFGNFQLDPTEHLLLRDGQAVPLTPKTFDLLVFLVSHPGRLVTKDQILAAVWPESFVEEANLTVSVSALRKALGERPGEKQYIDTVPKKGYRFTAAVREVPGVDTAVGQIDKDKNLFTAAGESVRSNGHSPNAVTPLIQPTLDTEGLKSTEVMPSVAVSEKPSLSRMVLVSLLLALCTLAGLGSYLYLRKQSASRTPLAPRSLAVLPFQNLRHDPNEDFLGFSLADAIITKLGYVSSLTVRPSAAVQKYRDQVIDIPKVAAELNVDTLLTGNFIRDGDDLRITYQLVDAKTDKIIDRGTVDLKYDKLLTVQDNVAQQIVKGLELNLSPSEAARLKPDTPINPSAYEFYLRGIDLYARHDFPLAISMLEKSVAIDPNYALTWAYLGASYTSDAAFEFGGREQYHKAQAAYERALVLQPTQLEAKIFLANSLIDTGKVEQALPLLRDALQTNPNHAAAHWELGYAYRFAGMLQESVAECERARKIDPLVRRSNGAVLNTYLYLGEYDKFLRSLPEVSDSAFIVFYRGFGEFYQKNWEQAAKDLDRAYELDSTLYTQIGKALSDSIAKKNLDGLKILRQAEEKIQQRGVGDPEATYKIAQAYSVLGDKESAVRMLRYSIENGFFSYPYFLTDPLLEGIGREPQFAQLMNSARTRHEAFKRSFFELD
jgi:DNA-binding winged helix-turn-helix (wHTH) protein/TolB-like protein/Tfp pilus assembly protein PilF